MIALGQIYKAQLKANLALQFQYRAALLIWLIGMVLEPVVYLVVWSAVADARGGAVGGFDRGQFAAYYIILMVVNHLTFTWTMWEYDWRVRHGDLSFMLLRPIHPIHNDFCENLSYKFLTLIVMIPTTLALWFAFQPELDLRLEPVFFFAPALIGAFTVQFLFGWLAAMLAFWTTRIQATNQLYFSALLFFSGKFAPLNLFPEWIRALADFLPFRWMLSFPVELLMGRLTRMEMILGLGMQGAWIVLGLILIRVVWREGVKRYAAFGA
jgi:ABC-2 type transport system permease protein